MAFSPTQIKSVFNRGTFDPNDPRISYQRARLPSRQARAHMATKMQGAAHIPDRRIWEELTRDGATVWEKLREGRGAARDQVDRLRIKIQDRFLPMRRAQEALVLQTGVRLTPEQNVYLTETTFSGKAGRHLFEIDEKYTKPIIDMIAETNGALTSDDVGQWLYARHAVERNARIASINPKMPDGGSGMTDAEAAKIMADAAAAPHAADLTKIGTLIDDLRERTLKLREDAGLITATEAAIWRAQYKHYVPLKGFAETDHSEAVLDITGAGRRFNVRGDESKRALGRKSEAFNPLQAAITQAQEASIRAEKNRVGQAMLKLAEDYPQPALWEVKKPVQKQYFNKTTGLVETRTEAPVSLMQEPNEMAVKRDGQEFRVMFKDPRLARALGNVGADQMGAMLRVLSPLSRWYSATRTTLNPEFVITNAMRDFETAQINATALPVNGKARIAKAMAKNWRKAFVGVLRGQGGAEDTVWTKRYAEFQKAGGQVSFWVLEQPEAGKSDMDKRIARARGGAAARTLKAMIAPSFRDNLFLSSIERVNLAVDNAIRLAAFAEARDMGLNEQDAASLAKNLTVNFNRRGEWGSALNIVYPFFNAAVQGSARLIQAMKNPKMLVGLTVGGVGLGVVMDLVNASLSEEDDDGELLYDKVPDYRSRRFLHVVYGSGDGDTPWSIPLAYGYNIFPYAGQQLGKVIRGVKKPEDAFADTAEAFAQAWLPTDSLIPGLIVEPAWELATNENYFGSAIMPEDSWGNSKYIPPSERYFPSATEASKTVASTLNKWTGGNSVDAGAVSVSPEVIDYWTAYAFGSFGRFAGQTTDNLTKALQGKAGEIEARDMPFAKNLWSEVSDYDTKDRYKRFGFAVRDAAYDIANIGEDEELPAETKKLSALLDALKKAEREIDGTSEFNQDGRKYGGVPPRDPEAVMTEFNKLFIKAAGKQAE